MRKAQHTPYFLSPAALALHATCLLASADSPRYEVTAIIQGPPCAPFNDPSPISIGGMNEAGMIAGSYRDCFDTDLDVAFVWSVNTGITLVHPLSGMNTGVASAINDHSQLTGYVTFSGSGVGWIAFLSQGPEITTVLGIPLGGTHTRGNAINNKGWIVGDWGNTITGIPTPLHAFLWRDEILLDIGAELDRPFNQARDVNDSGAIVGWMGDGPAISEHAFLWQAGVVTDLGTLLDGPRSAAAAINNNGTIIGGASVRGPAPSGFVGHPVAWIRGQIVDLGVLPGLVLGSATDVNDFDQIVGSCANITASVRRAFIWENGMMTNLNDLIPPDSGVILTSGGAINNAGQIAASGRTSEGFIVGVILTPIDPPFNPADLNRDGVINTLDLGMLLVNWSIPARAPGCGGASPCPADLNNDGFVNSLDLGILLSSWTLK